MDNELLNNNFEVEHQDFIAIYKNVFQDGYCKHVVESIMSKNYHLLLDRFKFENQPKHSKDDLALNLFDRQITVDLYNGENPLHDTFWKGLQICFHDYSKHYSILLDQNISCSEFKYQMTSPGSGYHIWHSERGFYLHHRVLVYMLYLNTLSLDEGGETEFLYQRKRIKPTENVLIIWPASFTHTHRGNMVLGNTYKHVITGWFNYV